MINLKQRSNDDDIVLYEKVQIHKHIDICQKLRIEIDAALPKAASRIYYAMPVWFVGDNPVVGYNATSKYVNLLFWNGRSFGEKGLQAAGKYNAAQIKYTDVSEINPKLLRRWLKEAGTKIWNYKDIRKGK
jgi:hypothetical protein